jgi:hypothetical protein
MLYISLSGGDNDRDDKSIHVFDNTGLTTHMYVPRFSCQTVVSSLWLDTQQQ